MCWICAETFDSLHQVENKNKMETTSQELDKKVQQFITQMELVKTLTYSPPLLDLISTARNVMKDARTYLDKRLALLQKERIQKDHDQWFFYC